jgi:hypothetical protein
MRIYRSGDVLMHHSLSLVRMFIGFCACLAAPLCAKDKDKDTDIERPAIIQKLYDCRTIADSAARLACYDAQVGQLAEAEASKAVVIADKETVKKTEKGLFGFTLPKIGLFGGDGDQIAEIEGKIASVRRVDRERWAFTLEDGAKWVQLVPKDLTRLPKAGMTVKIRRASLGSFLANIDDQPAIKVKREN